MTTKEKVHDAQKKWGDAIVKIGKLSQEVDFETLQAETMNILDDLYAFTCCKVLFKPTKAGYIQFRNTEEAALSYFIGGNKDYLEDSGFALQPWVKVEFENSDIIINKTSAIAMGNYYFTDSNGDTTKVEFTFGYLVGKNDELKIELHQSSLPFNTAETVTNESK